MSHLTVNKLLTVIFKWRTCFLRNSLVMTVHQQNPKEIKSRSLRNNMQP